MEKNDVLPILVNAKGSDVIKLLELSHRKFEADCKKLEEDYKKAEKAYKKYRENVIKNGGK